MSLGTVTVLFTDLVGSTEMVGTRGESEADRERRAHIADAQSAIDRHEGVMVKSLGDGVMARFASAVDAIRASLAIQQATMHRRDAAFVRVGIAAGDVEIEDDGDLSGLPVHEAARLCNSAGGGQILVSGTARALAGRRVEATLRSIGELELRGFDEPVEAFEVIDPAQNAGPVPLPTGLETKRRMPFVARTEELDALDEEWKLSRTRAARLVVISGDAGVGKSRLIETFTHRAHQDGALVLAGRCDPDVAVPYGPVVQALTHLTRHLDLSALPGIEERHLGLVSQLLHGSTPTGPVSGEASDAAIARHELFDAVWRVLGSAAERNRGGMVIVADDLQWASEGTIAIVRFLLSHCDQLPVLLLGTCRTSEVRPDMAFASLLTEISTGEGQGHRLALQGLGSDDVAALLEAAAGSPLDEAASQLAHSLCEQTGGNPLFVGELLLSLIDTGRVVLEDGHYVTSDAIDHAPLPSSIRDSVNQRMAGLHDNARRVLEAAAVIGVEFELETAAKVVGIDLLQAVEHADEALNVGLLSDRTSTGPLAFNHDLIRRGLYEGISAPRRSLLHGQVATLLEERHPEPSASEAALLAHHWRESLVASRAEKVAVNLLRAGDGAMTDFAYDDALELYESANEAGPELAETSAAIRLGMALASRALGRDGYREDLADAASAAMEVGRHDLVVRAALSIQTTVFARPAGLVPDHLAIRLLEGALALPELPDPDRARMLARLAVQVALTDADQARAIAEQAESIARALSDPAVLAFVLVHRGSVEASPSTVESRQKVGEEAAALARRAGDLEMAHAASWLLAGAAAESGEARSLETHVGDLGAVGAALGRPAHAYVARWMRTAQLLALEPGKHEHEVDACFAVGVEAGYEHALFVYTAQLFQVRWDRGALLDLIPAVENLVTESPHILGWRAALAVCHSENDQLDAATEVLELFADRGWAVPLDWLWSTTHMLLGESLTRTGVDPSVAAILHDRVRPYADRCAVTANVLNLLGSLQLPAAVFASLAGRTDDAESHFSEALRVNQALGNAAFEVRTLRGWAEHHMRVGEADARQFAERARQLADRWDMAAELRRIDRLL